MDRRAFSALTKIAGRGAIDFGVALFPRNLARINACAIGATVEATPFFERYQFISGNTTLNRGLARNSSGELFESYAKGDSAAPTGLEVQTYPCKTNTLVPDARIPGLKLLTCDR